MGGRMKIVMEGNTNGVGRQAGYFKWRYGGREGREGGEGRAGGREGGRGREGGGREGGRILRMKELKPLYQLYLISMM